MITGMFNDKESAETAYQNLKNKIVKASLNIIYKPLWQKTSKNI